MLSVSTMLLICGAAASIFSSTEQDLAEEADLVSIHSKEEQRFFQGLVREMNRDCWIGLKLEAHGWVWSDGSALDYVNWDEGEPSSGSTEKWVHMRPWNGKWNNVESDYQALVGCKKPAGKGTKD
ncbi:unnamed protein product, partial [Mesorhabditis belari]|uniref:C-type lectin domain-containing protein n=1 Tax=Mesorhabditis belari TaxID=2138241 RepID=A0AAF3F7M6_9BILA